LYAFSPDKFRKNTFTKPDLSNNPVWPIDTLGGVKSIPSLLDKSKFDTIMLYGKVQLVYNGWPLYYFGSDSLKRGGQKRCLLNRTNLSKCGHHLRIIRFGRG